MKVVVFVKATKGSEAGEMPSAEAFAAMSNFNEELINAGILLDGAGLGPGARVQFSGADRTVIDGPFAETKELIAGFSVWEVKSLQEAIDWVKKSPNLTNEDCEVEIRPYFLHDLEDFGDALTPELKEQEARQDAQLKSKLK